jgi:hypothetical protein
MTVIKPYLHEELMLQPFTTLWEVRIEFAESISFPAGARISRPPSSPSFVAGLQT